MKKITKKIIKKRIQDYIVKKISSKYFMNIMMHLQEDIKEWSVLNRIQLNHTWPEITRDVEKYIAKCEYCQKNKLVRKAKVPLKITDTPDKPFEKCALNIVGLR